MRILAMLLFSVCVATLQAEDIGQRVGQVLEAHAGASATVKKFVAEHLLAYCSDATLAKEVAVHNNKKISLDKIKALDQEWKDAEEELPIMLEVLENTTAKKLREIMKKHPEIVEVFVMDNQGAVVGENDLTSDYWQGDEAKWQNSFAKGQGGVDVGKEELDKSSNQVLQQVSLPIIKDGQVIGAVTWGLNVSKIK